MIFFLNMRIGAAILCLAWFLMLVLTFESTIRTRFDCLIGIGTACASISAEYGREPS